MKSISIVSKHSFSAKPTTTTSNWSSRHFCFHWLRPD